MTMILRRTVLTTQHTYEEGGKKVDVPTLLVAAMAIIKNPWHGRGWVADLSTEIREVAPSLGKLLTDMVLSVTGDKIEGYGKASVVGMEGEIEHAQAITHSLWFGNQFRDAVQAKSYLSFSNLRGGANCPIIIPLMDKDDAGRRSHYQTIHTSIADAPAPDELVVALGGSVGGHPLHRIGDRYQDLKEMGHDIDNPAGV